MVEVSILDTAEFSAEDYLKILCGLSEDRRKRAERYCTEGAKYLSAGAGYLLECALKNAGLSGNAVFYGEHGKPYTEGLHFNLSHSGTMAAIAVAYGEVGIDIQKIVSVKEALIKRVCTEREYAYLGAFSAEGREREFFRLWTGKESAGKFLGTGLPDPVEFEIDLVLKRVTRRGEMLQVALKEYLIDGYSLTVCAAEPFDQALEIIRYKERDREKS